MANLDSHQRELLRNALLEATRSGEFSNLWHSFLPVLQQRSLSTASLEAYRAGLTYYLRFLQELPEAPHRLDFEREFRLWLMEQRSPALAAATVRQYVLAARHLQRALLPAGESLHQESVLAGSSATLPFTSSEIGQLLAQADNQLCLVILLACEAGLRPGQMRQVTPLSIDLERCEVFLHAPDRFVPLSPALHHYLSDYLTASQEGPLITGANVVLERRLSQAAKRAGVDCRGRSLHSLRVYAAARLLMEGHAFKEVQRRLGLASRTNGRRYEAALHVLLAAGEGMNRPAWELPAARGAGSQGWQEGRSELLALFRARDLGVLELLLEYGGKSETYRKNLRVSWRHFLEWFWAEAVTQEIPDHETVWRYEVYLRDKAPALAASTIALRLSHVKQYVRLLESTVKDQS